MHIQAYFSLFTLIMPKANHFNKYSICCSAQLQRCFFRKLIPPIKVVASYVGQPVAVENAAAASRHVILRFSCLLHFMYLPNHSSVSSL